MLVGIDFSGQSDCEISNSNQFTFLFFYFLRFNFLYMHVFFKEIRGLARLLTKKTTLN